MRNAANSVGRWAVIGALGISALMIIYYLAGGNGQVAFGMAVISLVIATFLYLFYARMNTVQRTGDMALLLVILIALLLPFFFLASSRTNAEAAQAQYVNQLKYAAGKYATYCASCHGLLGQGISGPALQGNKDLEKININAVITAGIYNQSDPSQYVMPAWSENYGGPFNDDDINALTAFVQSWDPVLNAKNNTPTNDNGFNFVESTLTADQQPTYAAQATSIAVSLANGGGPTDTPADLTAMTAVTIPIVADPANTNGASWNFLYPLPNGTSTRVVKIKVGTTVTWNNKSGQAHSIISGKPGLNTGLFDIPLISDGTQQTFTFTQAGTVNYYCGFHPAMIAQIQVEP